MKASICWATYNMSVSVLSGLRLIVNLNNVDRVKTIEDVIIYLIYNDC